MLPTQVKVTLTVTQLACWNVGAQWNVYYRLRGGLLKGTQCLADEGIFHPTRTKTFEEKDRPGNFPKSLMVPSSPPKSWLIQTV